MTVTVERLDLIVYKGSRFYQEFQQVEDDLSPMPLTDKTVKCYIKESLKSSVRLFELTEGKGGTVIVDRLNGIFGIQINSDQTDIAQTVGIYDIMLIDINHPTIDSERIVEGKILFSEGVTKQ